MAEAANKETENEFDIEIEDDTPPEDRGREPLPQELVKELEDDELEEYSEKVKVRLKQMKKVWHDERREKERALREQQAALEVAQKLQDEIKTLRSKVTENEGHLVNTAKNAVELELKNAEKAYKEAYEAGDSDKLLEAQKQLTEASYRLERLKGYKPPVQPQETEVNLPESQPQAPRLDPKTDSWRRQNTWFGSDDEMTAAALGLNNKLLRERGAAFEGSDEYWEIVDKTMRKRFPEYEWGDEPAEPETKSPPARTERPATIVAPVSRSTTSKKVKLNQSQLNVIKKMGITPEQYVREQMKLERANG
jgi:hypothetical protein